MEEEIVNQIAGLYVGDFIQINDSVDKLYVIIDTDDSYVVGMDNDGNTLTITNNDDIEVYAYSEEATYRYYHEIKKYFEKIRELKKYKDKYDTLLKYVYNNYEESKKNEDCDNEYFENLITTIEEVLENKHSIFNTSKEVRDREIKESEKLFF